MIYFLLREINMSKKIYRRGPVTMENIIIHKNGSVSCPFSTNSYTDDEYFTIDYINLSAVLGRSWRVHNDHASSGGVHYNIRTGNGVTGTILLHRLIHNTEAGHLEVDHLLHFSDNRRASVDFVTKEENTRRGAAIYHKGYKNRKSA